MHRIAFLVSLILISVGCSHRIIRKIGRLPSAAPASIDVQEIDFDYLQGKAKLVFRDNDKQQEVKAHIRIRKDSVIWMKLTVLGLQGGSVLINKDSITIVADWKNEYYVFNYEDLSKKFNFKIDYNVVQAALLGNLVIPKRPDDEIEGDLFFNKLVQKEGSVTVQSLINKTTKKVERINLNEPSSGNAVKINYSEFQPVGNRLFPYKGLIEIIFKSQTGVVNNTILFEYSKAEVGTKELRFHFKIPKRYDRR